MLQQILDEMYIEPDLLVELDEEQKQILFCKMREEQVRRWKLREEKLEEEEREHTPVRKQGGKKVSFLMGSDGEPIVVVLGGDQDVEHLLQEKARKQAESEADIMRKAAEEELDKIVRLSQSTIQAMEHATRNLQLKERDPTREAVVQSLHEATQEMERQVRALEQQERNESLLVAAKKMEVSPQANLPLQQHQPVLPTPPPSPPYEEATAHQVHVPTSFSAAVRSASNMSSPLSITVTPYSGKVTTSVGKLCTSTMWESSGTNATSKPPILTPKPTIAGTFAASFSPLGVSPNTSSATSPSTTPIKSFAHLHSPSVLPAPATAAEDSSSTVPTNITFSLSSNQNVVVGSCQSETSSPDKIALGVADHIRQWEQLSQESLEALKTATLERAKKRRQKEIFEDLKSQVEAAKREAAEGEKSSAEKDDVVWQEQERKAKEAEQRIREIARRAREEHRRTLNCSFEGSPKEALNRNVQGYGHTILIKNGFSNLGGGQNGYISMSPKCKVKQTTCDINGNINRNSLDDQSNNNSSALENLPVSSRRELNLNLSANGSRISSGTVPHSAVRPPKPSSRDAIIAWFREEEISKGAGLNAARSGVAVWFHGIISRVEAEEVLSKYEVGSFLVRVSERIWGYAVSYRAADRCRHYLIDVVGGKYAFLGSHQAAHLTLGDLVEYHSREPITVSGAEYLTKPCGQVDPRRPDYLELFTGTQYLSV